MKYLIFAILVILSGNISNAQTKLGLRINPGIITQRISYSDDINSIKHSSNAFNLSALLFADVKLSNNYFFTTGVGYTSKRLNLSFHESVDFNTHSKQYNIQYVQIPATLKLYTGEIALDKKLYFQFGPLFEVAVHTKETNLPLQIVDTFQPFDISLLFASGLQLQIAPQTAVQLGFNYTRGLINIVKSPGVGIDDLVIKNDIYAIEVAVKF